MATGARSYQGSIPGLTITACQAPRRISSRKTSRRSHAPLRKTRREHHDTIRPGSDRRHRHMVAIAAKVDGQALAGSRRDRRLPGHGRIVLACRDDRIGCVSRGRRRYRAIIMNLSPTSWEILQLISSIKDNEQAGESRRGPDKKTPG